jgi:uncharacterized protein (TIGR02466 family)
MAEQRFGEAAAWLTAQRARRPHDPQLAAQLGTCWSKLSHHARAIECFRAALSAPRGLGASQRAGLHNDLGASLVELGQLREALVEFDSGLALEDSAALRVNRAHVLSELGDAAGALDGYARALELTPGAVAAELGLGIQLRELGRTEEARRHLERAARLAPEDPRILCELALLEAQGGNVERAFARCDEYLARFPGRSGVLALLAPLAFELGLSERAAALLDYPRWVHRELLDPPPEFGDARRFHQAVAQHVIDHPSLAFSPKSHATRAGRHSGELLVEPLGPLAALERTLTRAIAEYWRRLPNPSEHPFVQARPASVGIHLWGVVLEEQGHQLPHVHPDAWLSGVFYAAVPDSCRKEESRDGWLEFGAPEPLLALRSAPPTLLVAPEPGLLVLFPSYFYHRTLPFEGEGTRVSLAFDVIPGPRS